MNHINALHVNEPNETPREWNIQPLSVHFKFRTSPSKTTPVVLTIMGRLSHHSIDNGDVEV